MKRIDKKIFILHGLTNNFLYIEWYSHDDAFCYKIDNQYTAYRKDVIVLCKVREGFEHALDLAIEAIQKKKQEFWEGKSK